MNCVECQKELVDSEIKENERVWKQYQISFDFMLCSDCIIKINKELEEVAKK